MEWLDNVDLTGQAEHIDKMKKIAGLSEGKSLKTEKQRGSTENSRSSWKQRKRKRGREDERRKSC